MNTKIPNIIRTKLLLTVAWELTRKHQSIKFTSLSKPDKSTNQEIFFEEFHSNCHHNKEDIDSDKHSAGASNCSSGISSSINTRTSSHPKIMFNKHNYRLAIRKNKKNSKKAECINYLRSYSFLIKKFVPLKVKSEKKINRTIKEEYNKRGVEKRNTWHIQLKK